MGMTRRLWGVLAVLVAALAVILCASRELRLTARDQLDVIGRIIAGDRNLSGYGGAVFSLQPPGWQHPSAHVKRRWQWLVLEAELPVTNPNDPGRVIKLEQALKLAPRGMRTVIECRIAAVAAWLMRLDRPEARIGEEHPRRERQEPTDIGMAKKVIEYAPAAWLGEPNNALYPQLIAAAYLAQHRDAEALAMLERAARLTGWSDHHSDVLRILVQALRMAGQSRVWSHETALAAGFPADLRAIDVAASTAAELGYRAQRAGDDALALRWYGAVYSMAPPILRHAKWAGEAGLASALPLYPARSLAASVQVPKLRGMRRLESEVRTMLLVERMHDYLAQHGRPDLAQQAVIETARADLVRNGLQTVFFSNPLWDAEHDYAVVWPAQLWVMFLLLVCIVLTLLGAVAAAVWSLKKPRPTPRQANQDTATLGAAIARILLVVVPVAVLAIGLPFTVLYLSEVAPRLQENLDPRLMLVFIVIILLALLFVISAVIEAWRWLRRRQREVSFAARWLQEMGAMLPRIVAALLLLYLLMFIPVSRYGAELERCAAETIERGDLPSYITYGLFPERGFRFR